MSEQEERAIFIDALEHNKDKGEFCGKILEATISTDEIPGVTIFRADHGCTVYGYIIEYIDKFLNWCGTKNIKSEDMVIILLCQNLWFYTSGGYTLWQISELPKTFADKLIEIKETNSAHKNKESKYVVNMENVEKDEWRIYPVGSDKFEKILEALKGIKNKDLENLNVKHWVEAFCNNDPTKLYEGWRVSPSKFANEFIGKN